MKNKKLLIGIVSGLILIIIAVGIGLLLGGGKKEEEAPKPKETKKLNETRTFEGYEFKDAKVKEQEGKYAISVQVTNKSAKEEATRIVILYYGADEKDLGGAVCMVPKLEKGKTIDFNCACDVKEILNAVDYKVIATDKEISELKQS